MEDACGDRSPRHTDDRHHTERRDDRHQFERPGYPRHNNHHTADDIIPRPRRIRRQNTNSSRGGDGPWASSGTRNNADDIIPRPRGRRTSVDSADMSYGSGAARRRKSGNSSDINRSGAGARRRNSGESNDARWQHKSGSIGQSRHSGGSSGRWGMEKPLGLGRSRSPDTGWRAREQVRENERAREEERTQEQQRVCERERRRERERDHERRKELEIAMERQRERLKACKRAEEMERREEKEREHERRRKEQERQEREKKEIEEREERNRAHARRRLRHEGSSSSSDASENAGRERSYGSRGVLDQSAKLPNQTAKRDLSPVATRCERPKLCIVRRGPQGPQSPQGLQSPQGQEANSDSSSSSSDSNEKLVSEQKPKQRAVIQRSSSSRGHKRAQSQSSPRCRPAPRSKEASRRSRDVPRQQNASVRRDEFGRAIISRSQSPSISALRQTKSRRLDSRRRSNSRQSSVGDPIFLLVKSRDCGRIIGSRGYGLKTLANELKDEILRDRRAFVDVLCQPYEERDRITDERFLRIIGIPTHLRQDAIDHILLLVHECRDQHGETLRLSEERRMEMWRDRAARRSRARNKSIDGRRVFFSISNRDCGKIIAEGLRNVAKDLVHYLDDRRVTFDKLLITIQPYAERKKESDVRQVTVFGVPVNLEKEVYDFFEPKVEYMENYCGEVIKNKNPNAVTVEIRIPQVKVGLLLGMKGATIKRLQESSNVLFTLNQKTKDEGYSMLHIEGCEKNIEVAKKMVDDLLSGNRVEGESADLENGEARSHLRGSSSYEMRISQGKVGLLLGSKGATIRRLQEDANVEMILHQKTKHDGYSLLVIEGKKKDIKEAVALVDELLCVETNPSNPHKDADRDENKRKDGSDEAEGGLLSDPASDFPASTLLPLSTPPPFPVDGKKAAGRPGLIRPSMMPPPMMSTCVAPSMFIQEQRPVLVPMTSLPPFDLHRGSVRPGGMSLVTAPQPVDLQSTQPVMPMTASGFAPRRPHMDAMPDTVASGLSIGTGREKVNYADL